MPAAKRKVYAEQHFDAFFRSIDWHVVERRLTEPIAIRSAAAA